MADLSASQKRAVLIATILGSAMAFIDSTALNVALPALQSDLAIDASDLLWVVNGYALFLSSFLLVGGSLGDLYGRKKIFTVGMVIFTAASVACGFSSSSETLILSRCVQGIGAAMMVPGSLSLISALFSREERGTAIGTWSMFSSLTTVLGPVIGGWLVDLGEWRFIFFLNVPVACVALGFLLLKVPESMADESGRLDIPGSLLAVVSLGGITYGFIEAPGLGFDHPTIRLALLSGLMAGISFVYYEHRTVKPMMPTDLFRSRVFSCANAMTLLIYSALGGILFFFPLNLIQVQNYSAEQAGLALLPFGLLIAVLSKISGRWADARGVRTPLIIGPAFTSLGFYLLAQPGITGGPGAFWTSYFPAVMVMGIGMGITVAPLTTAVMNAVPTARTGTASGVNNTIARAAAVLAVAILGAVVLFTFESQMYDSLSQVQLTDEAMRALQQELPKAAEAEAPEAATAAQRRVITESIESSFVYAFQIVSYIGTILAATAALMAWYFLRK